jgi:hypothetical protein
MQVSARSYLTAGLSFVAAGAIIGTPMSPPAPQQEPSHPLVRDQQVQLAALAAPTAVHNPATTPQAVHVLAEVSRAVQSAKTANATSAVGATAAAPSVARTKVAQPAAAATIPSQASALQTSAGTTPDPENADTPDAAGSQSLAPRSAAVNAFDPPGVANVLVSATQLVVDAFVVVPADLMVATASNFQAFLLDAATLNPHSLSDFLTKEGDTIQQLGDQAADIIGDDVQQLQESVGDLFDVSADDESVAAVAAAKTVTKPGAAVTSPVSGAVDKTTEKTQQGLDAGSKGIVTGKHSQDVSAKPAKVNTPGQKDDTSPAKQSGTETKDQPTSKTADATKSDATKGDTTTPSGQSTSTSTNNEHGNAVSSSVNNATKDKGTTKTNSSTHTPSRTPSHAASSGAKHSGVSGAKGGHSGRGGKGGHSGK